MRSVVELLCVLLAVASIGYGIMVLSLGTGTMFCIAWFLLGGCFGFLTFAIHIHMWQMLPKWLQVVVLLCFFIGLIIFLLIEGLMIKAFRQPKQAGLDYIIVLGAQVYEDGPSVVLKYRLDEALAYLNENPDTICIVSGGQGYNEPFPEAAGMAAYLMDHGISESRIIREAASTTTLENMQFSRLLIDESCSVGIVTNNFHLYRAMQMAKKAGFLNICGIAAPSTAFYLPNNLFREFFAEIKFLIGDARGVLEHKCVPNALGQRPRY